MEAEGEVSTQHKRGQSSNSAPAGAGHRREKRVRFELPEEPSQDGRMRLNMKQASGTGAEELEP